MKIKTGRTLLGIQKRHLPNLIDTRHFQGRLLGKIEGLVFELKQEASLGRLTNDIVKSSAIARENLNPEDKINQIPEDNFMAQVITSKYAKLVLSCMDTTGDDIFGSYVLHIPLSQQRHLVYLFPIS